MSDDKSEDLSSFGIPASACGWDETLDVLCRELRVSKSSHEARERFFAGYRNACKRVALRPLSDPGF
jgi:hypothetical protein